MNLWWAQTEPNIFEGAPFRLCDMMSLKRFRAIDTAIRYTSKKPRPKDFTDKFHDMRELQDAFNQHTRITTPLHGSAASMN